MKDFKILFPVFKELSKHKFLLFLILVASILIQIGFLLPEYFFSRIIDLLYNYGTTSDLLQLKNSLVSILVLFIILVIPISIARLVQSPWIANITYKTRIAFSEKIFSHLLKSDVSYILDQKTGALVSKINRGSNSFIRVLNMYRWNIAPLFVQGPVIIYILFSVNTTLALIAIAKGIFYVPISMYYSKKAAKKWKDTWPKSDRSNGILTDLLSNLLIIKINNQEKYSSKKYGNSINYLKNLWQTVGLYYGKWTFFASLISDLFLVVIVILGFKLFLNGSISIGDLTLAFMFTNRLSHVFDTFIHGFNEIFDVSAQFNSASKLLKVKPKVLDDKDAKPIKINKGNITFNNVSFNYDNKKVFSKFNLDIRSGQTLGIVGRSGTGKSTLINLLYRLYDLDGGYISIDGQNIKHVKQGSLRSSMTLVPQETILFDDTIYNNVKFGNINSNYRDVINALKKAELWHFVQKLPNKEKTIVGERGIKLSGGERQRVAIARAILANKHIIILDEATSSLDSETEAKIRDTFNKLTKGKTTVIVAHRLSTVMNADKIIVFDKGKIVEVGTHKQLLKKKGKYSELWKYQSQGFI